MPPRVAKEAANAHDQKVNDKTFGMKNKNKSKQVQNKISHMKMSGGAADSDASFAKQARPLLHTSVCVLLQPCCRLLTLRCSAGDRRRNSRRLPRTRWTWSSSRRRRRRVRSRGRPRMRAKRRRRRRSLRSATSTSTFASRRSKTVRRRPAFCPVHTCPGHLVAAGRLSLRA